MDGVSALVFCTVNILVRMESFTVSWHIILPDIRTSSITKSILTALHLPRDLLSKIFLLFQTSSD